MPFNFECAVPQRIITTIQAFIRTVGMTRSCLCLSLSVVSTQPRARRLGGGALGGRGALCIS